ncbi:MAG: hypothetical protein HOQ20_15810 [Bradyrhizobium sp.]|nr:hypothetical protein [Bradyrhizobium sp.]
MRAYPTSMGTRSLLAFVIMMAVLFASAVTGTATASAATMNHDMQMMEMGHCASPPAKENGKAPVKSCCIAMCMAVAIAPTVPAQLRDIHHQTAYFAVPTSWHGYLGEIATPPPRLA